MIPGKHLADLMTSLKNPPICCFRELKSKRISKIV
jgi:hypothetical protein